MHQWSDIQLTVELVSLIFKYVFYILLTVYLCIILYISPTRCTILFNIFIYFSSVHVSGIHVPIIRRKFDVSLRQWCLSLCMGGVWSAGWIEMQPADQKPLIQNDKYKCHIDTVLFSWWWAHGCPKHVEKWNKYINQNFAPSWTYL